MADLTSDATKNFGVLSSLEKSTEISVFLLMFVFLVFADSGLIFMNGFGICEFAFRNKDLGSHIAAQLLLIFIVFSFFMSVVMPFLSSLSFVFMLEAIYGGRGLLRGLWRATRTYDQLRREDEEYVQRNRANTINDLSAGYVHLYEIRKKAYKNNSGEDRYTSLYEKEKEKEDAHLDAARKTSLYAYSAFYVCTLNVILYIRMSALTFSGYIIRTRVEDGYIIITLVLTSLLTITYVSLTRATGVTRKVYCPPLAKELEQDFRNRREMEAKFEEEMLQNAKRRRHESGDPEVEF